MKNTWLRLIGIVLGLMGWAVKNLLLNIDSRLAVHPVYASNQSLSYPIYFPLLMNNYIAPVSRLGIDASPDIGNHAIGNVHIGGYVDWDATMNPSRPNGIT